MATINRAAKEISVKVVYYGPGLCGKTTNLQQIYDTANPEKRGKLLSVATETDRTLFFDFLPIDLGTIKGLKLKVGLYTVPGQVFYDATRRLVLRGADGVVFVADSQPAMLDNNLESMENLKINLRLNNLDPDTIPLVIQFNKRDLPNALDEKTMGDALNWRRCPVKTAAAAKGMGVHETLKEIVKVVIASLNDKVDGAGGTVSAAAIPAASRAVPPAPSFAPGASAASPAPPPPPAPNPAPAPPAAPPPMTRPSPPAPAPAAPPASAPVAAQGIGGDPLIETMSQDEAPPVIEEAPILDLSVTPAPPAPAPSVAPPPPPAAGPALAAPPPPPAAAAAAVPPDMRAEILRSRLQMLESQLAALEAILGEMRAELDALRRL